MALDSNIGEVSRSIDQALSDGLKAGGELVLEKANQLVPVESGDLKDSGIVTVDGDTATVTYTSEYALKQHERLDFDHPGGGHAKFLEIGALANAAAIEEEIAERIRARLT